MSRSVAISLGLAACVLFVMAGVAAAAPLAGIENDESLFGSALYAPHVAYSIAVPGGELPLMLMSYVGALKGLLYAPIFRLWTPGAYSIRVPVVVIGAITVWLFFLMLRRLAGDRVAVIGAALLATDSLFFLTTVFDWGPVALQHLLLLAAMLALVRFSASERWLDLVTGFFCLGLAVWDKALFIWVLAGLIAGTLGVLRPELARLFSWRRVFTAIAAFTLGALPLILYNVSHTLETFRTNSSFAPEEIAPKFVFLIDSVQHGIADWQIANSGPGLPSALGVAFLAALLAWRWVPEKRLMQFAVIYMTVVWLLMAVTRNAGASVHHTVLLWPFPQLFIAVALGSEWPGVWKRVAMMAAVLLVAWNLVVLGGYYTRLSRQGGSLIWSDAIFPLAQTLRTQPKAYVVDWGILENLTLLDQGRIDLEPVWGVLSKPELTNEDRELLRQWMESPSAVFLAHADGSEFFRGYRARLETLAHEMGFREHVIDRVPDARGHVVFEILRFETQAPFVK